MDSDYVTSWNEGAVIERVGRRSDWVLVISIFSPLTVCAVALSAIKVKPRGEQYSPFPGPLPFA